MDDAAHSTHREEEGIAFGRITGVAAAPTEFYVLDAMESRIHVFDAKGRLLRKFGKRGAGPGELSNMPTQLMLWENRLVVVDMMNRRANRFAVDGKFIDSRPIDPTAGFPLVWIAFADRVVYTQQPLPMAMPGTPTSTDGYTLHVIKGAWDSPARKLADVAPRPMNDVSMSGANIKMKMDLRTPMPFIATDGNARILIATTDTYRIRIVNADGEIIGTLSRPSKRRKLSPAEITRLKKQLDSTMTAGFAKGAAAGAEIAARKVSVPKPDIELILPEYAPVIAGMIAGDQFALVGRPATLSADARPASEWDVIAYDNRYLGTPRLPRDFSPVTLTGHRLFGIERDDLKVESVAVYRLAAPRK